MSEEISPFARIPVHLRQELWNCDARDFLGVVQKVDNWLRAFSNEPLSSTERSDVFQGRQACDVAEGRLDTQKVVFGELER